MDYVRKFDIELDKDVYYAGETLTGKVVVQNIENIKVQGIRLVLRGKAHVEWKITRAGERRTVRDDEYYIDEKKILPETALPCSFESKIGTIRYYIRMTMDIPYSSSPQGIKYFTVIGPHIDCMDERYMSPCHAKDKRYSCCLCCNKGPVLLSAVLERSAYCCGENVRLKTEVQNGSDENVWIICRFVQNVEYFINKGVLGMNKHVTHRIWEFKTDEVCPHHSEKFENLQSVLQVPVVPTTLVDVCSVIQICYSLKVVMVMDNAGEVLELEFPVTVATVPFRIPNSPMPILQYDVAALNVEGGMYISSEFQLGQVYMGDDETDTDDVVLYRPIYVCVPHERIQVTNIEKEGKMSRAGSRISMTRLFEKRPFSPPKTKEVDKEDSSITDLNKDFLTPEMSKLDITEPQLEVIDHMCTDFVNKADMTSLEVPNENYSPAPSDSRSSNQIQEQDCILEAPSCSSEQTLIMFNIRNVDEMFIR
ncbi:hypothetical protein KUTeg_015994 [Tegillarca granosa]|uniref:Arrestin C-terminal-like domain-containing protein n=1 Tax=Tegillarca granosa TaxID=220873 RepID=A0ABQ9EJJ3_TEGGR|nr:hypothetical protein KUTeg_015994 [Tegillarca granosa]